MIEATFNVVRAQIVGIDACEEAIPCPPSRDGDQEAHAHDSSLAVSFEDAEVMLDRFNRHGAQYHQQQHLQELDVRPHDSQAEAKIANCEGSIVAHLIVLAVQ